MKAIEMLTLSQGPKGKIAPGAILKIVRTPATIFEVTEREAEALIKGGSAKPAKIKTKETATITAAENALDPGATDTNKAQFDYETSEDMREMVIYAGALGVDVPQKPTIDGLRVLIKEKLQEIAGPPLELDYQACDDIDKLVEYAATIDIKAPPNATVAGLRKLIKKKLK